MRGKKIVLLFTAVFMMFGTVMTVSAQESAATFDYKTYADTYPDLKAAFGYDAEILYKHYVLYGKAEGRVGKFVETAETAQTAAPAATATVTAPAVSAETLDPLPPADTKQHAAWFMSLTPCGNMTNARLVAEWQAMYTYKNTHTVMTESVLVREENLSGELAVRTECLETYASQAGAFGENGKGAQIAKAAQGFQKAMESDLAPLKPYLGSSAVKYFGL